MLAYFRSKAALQRELDYKRQDYGALYIAKCKIENEKSILERKVAYLEQLNKSRSQEVEILTDRLDRAHKDHALEKEVIMRAFDGIGSALIQWVKE